VTKHDMAKKMVLFSVLGTIVAMIFMASSIIFPHPLLLAARPAAPGRPA